ncbi:MAG: histidine phosphatase family protein, partial [Nocardioides sp.]
LTEEPGFAEMEFGVWDGLTFTEVEQRFPGQVQNWLARDPDYAPEGGETHRQVRARVLAGLERVLDHHQGQTVVVVSHVTPIKTLVSHCLGLGIEGLFSMELSPASVTVLSFFTDADGDVRGSMRLYNALPPSADPFAAHSSAWFR